jgi:hypothetical protein
MARSFHLHPAQALTTEQLYTHWKWRVLLMFSGFYRFLSLGRFNFGCVILQIIDDLDISRTTIGLVNACMFWGVWPGESGTRTVIRRGAPLLQGSGGIRRQVHGPGDGPGGRSGRT